MAAFDAWIMRVLGHKNELFLMMIALVSVNCREGWMNPVILSVKVLTVISRVTCEFLRESSSSLMSGSA